MIFRITIVCRLVLLLGCLGMTRPAFALLSFPLSANQRGTVACLEKAAITYDIYLPPGYSTNGTPLPIFYTLNATGGGMVSTPATCWPRKRLKK